MANEGPNSVARGMGHPSRGRRHASPVPIPPTTGREARIGGVVHLHDGAGANLRGWPHAAAWEGTGAGLLIPHSPETRAVAVRRLPMNIRFRSNALSPLR